MALVILILHLDYVFYTLPQILEAHVSGAIKYDFFTAYTLMCNNNNTLLQCGVT